MIIDMILDRKDYEEAGIFQYKAKRFYDMMMAYGEDLEIGQDIARAMDYGEEQDVKKELIRYLDEYSYSHIPNLKEWVNKKNWLVNDTPV